MSDGHKISRPIQVCPANPLETEEQREYPSHRWDCRTIQVYPHLESLVCVYCGLTQTTGEPKRDLTPHIPPTYWQKLRQEMDAPE
jgi:hypothetical protein